MKKLIFIYFLFYSLTAFSYPFSLNGIDATPTMHTILEKTFLDVDVLKLELLFPKTINDQLYNLVKNETRGTETNNKIANIASHSEKAAAKITFLRNVSVNQFLNGILANLVLAKNQGYITEAQHQFIAQGLPGWYAFLKERGIKKGDEMFYKMEKDSMRIMYITVEGKTLLDQTDTGADKRLSVLGSYFATGSDFRKGLIESLF
ncbi:hypothetical protein K1X76_11485 [bacterium]|nr:hypothetical protein [bacterium]